MGHTGQGGPRYYIIEDLLEAAITSRLRLGRLVHKIYKTPIHKSRGFAMSSATTRYEESAHQMTPVVAHQSQREGLAALVEQLKSTDAHQHKAAYKLLSPSGEVTELPESALILLERVIEVLARGDALTVVPVGKELTTQQAANLLNVSRQYLVRLLDDGRIPHHKTGTHRRIRIEDLLTYKRQRDQERMTSLDDLSALSQDLGGYTELPTND